MPKLNDFDKSISNLLMVAECLLDARRIAFFKRAISAHVKPGDLVVDGGTGTGIIALFAARRGAKVYAVERDPVIAEIAKKNIAANNMADKVQVINSDIRDFKLPAGKHADVVVMEMLDTGMVAEQQAQAIIKLRENGVITEKSTLLPGKMDCQLRAINYDFNFYGFQMPMIVQARNYGAISRIKKRLSQLYVYAALDLRGLRSTVIKAEVEVVITTDGIVNALELKSDIYLGSKRCSDTSDMNMPVIVPIKEQRVKRGDVIKFTISYNMGYGFVKFKVT